MSELKLVVVNQNSRHKRLIALLLCLSQCIMFAGASSADDALRIENGHQLQAHHLQGSDARLQLLVTRADDDGTESDWTRRVQFHATPTGIVSIDSSGLVTPLADGQVQIDAATDDGTTASATLTVSGSGQTQAVSFAGQVVPIFSKLGCNGGGCHGKMAGQNGFRLSLLGFEPREDYKRLVAESRGRRVSLAAPDRSLLLTKTTGAVPHGGGARTDSNSHEYRLLRRWIAQGMPYDTDQRATVTSISVFPRLRRLHGGESQQLSVLATYSDGTIEDVTRAAIFESNDKQMADVSPTGLVTTAPLVGDVAVMARYQEHVSVFRAELPLRTGTQPTRVAQSDNIVDRYVGKKLDSLGIPPSPACDDATFLRRVTLDLTGRIPTLQETNDFLSDTAADRRRQLLDRLLESDHYATFFAKKWGVILRNRRSGDSLQVANMLFHHWLTESFRTNKPYDQLVNELLTASGSVYSNPAVAWLEQVSDQNQRVEDISQLFLGQRIQCARCHHHPYEKWSQEDYARLSAFFSTVSKKPQASEITFISRVAAPSAKHPRTGQSLKPAGLDAQESVIESVGDPRQTLGQWITAADNPFFAKALVNRYWKHFMGRGLVEPEDDLRVTNPPSNPELMDALAEAFVQSEYDLQSLIRVICLSQTYAASSDATAENVIDRRSHSRYYPKRLHAETLLDAIDVVTGAATEFAGMPTGTRAIELPDTGFDSYFLSVFGRPESMTACECERSTEANLAQSLHLLNSEQMQQKLTADQGRAAKLAADTSRPADAKVRELYQVAFSRLPTESELRSALDYLGDSTAQREPWEDLIWALVNAKEFIFNH
ncbi:DUF1553 domain-containing protein [Stieleria sp. TO1_6]|uniref:DUF1549 domain-containing protein n=1 Tax=Stieleria tagensis TaxID=2956795 RepID=UPI00209AB7BB|nr:DUF1549 domain-containing protein [Stieleria tagensis]MCO8121200.1 DUF1553 domain-containing protein [Stieleria tagensis]